MNSRSLIPIVPREAELARQLEGVVRKDEG
jgi:hypothetical protein